MNIVRHEQSAGGGPAAKQSVAATSNFGTARAGGIWLLELALNMKSPVIYDTDSRTSSRGTRPKNWGEGN